MLVSTPHSSRNTRRSGPMPPTPSGAVHQALRAWATSSRSCSAASALDRPGFQRLVAEVGLGHVGLVLGIEVSRLARSCRDWHQLLEMCALRAALTKCPTDTESG